MKKDNSLSRALLIKRKMSKPPNATAEHKFQYENEIKELVVGNSKLLFGEHAFLLNASGSPIHCHLLLNFSIMPKLYIAFFSLAKQDFGNLLCRITKLFAFMNQPDILSQLFQITIDQINSNKSLKQELTDMAAPHEELIGYLKFAFQSKPSILLITDRERNELPELLETYSDTWEKWVIPITIKRFSENSEFFCTMSPLFSDIVNVKPERIKTTEEEYFEMHFDHIPDDFYCPTGQDLISAP